MAQIHKILQLHTREKDRVQAIAKKKGSVRKASFSAPPEPSRVFTRSLGH